MPTVPQPLLWTGMLVLLTLCLTADLWIHRRPREISLAEAARWTGGWVALAVGCGLVVWAVLGGGALLQFLASYAVEWSLSVDNVFVFVAVIASLAVPCNLRYRVLFLGSLGAIVMRSILILAGSALLDRFDWLTYVFGGVLLLAAARFARSSGEPEEPAAPGIALALRRWLRVSGSYDRGRLTSVVSGRRVATPLLLAILLVAVTDVMFATDSIPAVFAMTRSPLLALGSNVLAVLGLRSLYFLVEGLMLRFRYLQPALVVLLALVALKMMAAPLYVVPLVPSLAGIVAILGGAALASWVLPRHAAPEPRG
ncbi:MAG TPA: TerC/Alx family metal homeostasis membrane protein [Candidatus Dormibacteraeota bacterium]